MLLWFIFLLFFLPISSKPLAPALYVFGDSLFENGNNNHLPVLVTANYLPYGQNFVQHATGRFTNGRILPDFIAELLELPYAPPFLSIHKDDLMPMSGLNYASSACGILSHTGKQFGECLSLGQQIDRFENTIETKLLPYYKSSSELSKYLAKSILLLTIGSNDYLQSYLEPFIFSTDQLFDPRQFAQHLIHALSDHFERLYKLGARKIIMLEVGPLGCIPHIIRKYKHTGKCHEEINTMVSYFNDKLHPMLDNLTSTLRGSTFVLAKVNSLVYDSIINPSKYGYIDSSNPCCTTWLNGTLICIPKSKPCPNPNDHFFWDGYHNTERANSMAASLCFNDTNFCSPTSIKELIQI